jgi:TPR repeat protein
LGLGVPRDQAEAYGWYENASLAGNGFAQHLRDDILTQMTPAEVTKGEQDAKDIAAEIKSAKK